MVTARARTARSALAEDARRQLRTTPVERVAQPEPPDVARLAGPERGAEADDHGDPTAAARRIDGAAGGVRDEAHRQLVARPQHAHEQARLGEQDRLVLVAAAAHADRDAEAVAVGGVV